MKAIISFYIVGILVSLVVAIGWIMNFVTLIHMSFSPITGIAVARAIGVFVLPLGGILGYM